MRQRGRHIHTYRYTWGAVEANHCISSQTIVTMHTRLPLQKKDDRPWSPGRQKIFTCSSVQQFFQVFMALSVWQLVFKGRWDCLSQETWAWFLRAEASSKEQESFWRGWEGMKSSMPVTQHKIAFSKTNASSVWGAGLNGYNNIRSIYFSLTHASCSFL